MDAYMAENLLRWRKLCHTRWTDWVFASPTMQGKQPYWPDKLRKRHIRFGRRLYTAEVGPIFAPLPLDGRFLAPFPDRSVFDLFRDSEPKTRNLLESGGTDGHPKHPEEPLETLIAPVIHPDPLP
jgi:hypothetical protein